MASITRLRRTTALDLAEVSGSPRPVLPPQTMQNGSTAATVVQLRRPTEPERSETTPAVVPSDESALTAGDLEADVAQRIDGIARSVAQGALEVLAGTRPLQQMARWLDPENYERLQLRANLVRCIADSPAAGMTGLPTSAHRHVIVRSARVCSVTTEIFEVSVVAFDQKRVRAVALRIEQRRGAWRVTALEIG